MTQPTVPGPAGRIPGAQPAGDLVERHFARILPIVGHALREARIAVLGLRQARPLVEYLAACGVRRWLWCDGEQPAAGGRPTAAQIVAEALEARHGAALALAAQVAPRHAFAEASAAWRPDLVLAVAGAEGLGLALRAAARSGCPAVLCAPPAALAYLPGDSLDAVHGWLGRLPGGAPGRDAWEWPCAAPLVAGLARAILLRDTAFARPDLAGLWSEGVRVLTPGGSHPCDIAWEAAGAARVPGGRLPFSTPPGRRGSLLVAGLGSLGSVAAALLAPCVEQLVLADPDSVEQANLARQEYRLADIGQPKAAALRDRLGGDCPAVIGLPEALEHEEQVEELIERHAIGAGLVATGTPADFAIARALRRRGLPHVVARCYPRARYWEAILVDGQRGPALEDIRGHLLAGPAPAPTPEQRAAYSDAGVLEAEPATLIESGWAATWAARLAHQLMAPEGLRERWLLELLAAGRTCLIGGAVAEQTAHGPAYAVALPGQVHAWGHTDIRTP
jgi:hypothetical protein